VEKVQSVISGKGQSKHISSAPNQYATIQKLLEAVISMWPIPRLEDEDHQQQQLR
jgi:hypothetical protein